VTGDLDVLLLTIEPGVVVETTGSFEIAVRGTLSAVGTGANPILLTRSSDNASGWRGLFFDNVPPGSELAHVIVEESNDHGIEIRGGSAPTIRDSVIRNNHLAFNSTNSITVVSLLGSGLYSDRDVVLERCSVEGNTIDYFCSPNCSASFTSSTGGAGVWVETNLEIIESDIANNSVSNYVVGFGAAAAVYGVGAFGRDGLTIVRSTVDGNSGFAQGSVGHVAWGGGVLSNGAMSIVNSIITRNSVSEAGAPGDGGGIFVNSSGVGELVHTTVANNVGGGVYAPNGLSSVNNSIVWANSPESIEGSPTVNYSIIDGGWGGAGSYILDLNPLFIEDDPGNPAYDVRIFGVSPAVDTGSSQLAGLPADDIDGNVRPHPSSMSPPWGYDMGAFEAVPVPEPSMLSGLLAGVVGLGLLQRTRRDG
jgi:hypothetical protein